MPIFTGTFGNIKTAECCISVINRNYIIACMLFNRTAKTVQTNALSLAQQLNISLYGRYSNTFDDRPDRGLYQQSTLK